jgi:4-deoxy-L-threo-5-hexosulose-uronate ketol-isomerase
MPIALRYLADPVRCKTMTSAELRASFLIDSLFLPGESRLTMVDADRAVIGGVMPLEKPIDLETPSEWKVGFFCDRREIGIMNVGGAGTVHVDGTDYPLGPRDCLYIGRGSRSVRFTSLVASNPSAYYLVSYPAHASHPTRKAGVADAATMTLGTPAESNQRTLRRYIHPQGIASCQLVMGYTELAPGSMWNTMPAHTHERRSEVYLYFDLTPESRVLHLMGRPEESRHLVVGNREAVVSPSWSMHSGVGTRNYCFVWAMGGENQLFEDMQGFPVNELR